MPQISVVIPVFNGESFIADSIQSVQTQTFKPGEIIVIDDGSTDQTSDIVHRLSGPVSIALLRRTHQGQGAALNAGIAVASGEWLAFLDADDMWYPEKLEIQVEHVKNYPQVGMFYSEMDAVDPSGNVKEHSFVNQEQFRRSRKKAGVFSMIDRGQPPIYRSSVLLRKDLATRVGGFHPSFRRLADAEFFESVAQVAPVHFISRALVKYRRRASEPEEIVTAWEESYLMLLDRLWVMWGTTPERQVFLLQEYMQRYGRRGVTYMQAREYQQARKSFQRALAYYPWSWKILRRWGISFIPGIRSVYGRRSRRKKTGG